MTTHSAGEAPGRDWLAFDRSDRWGLTAILGLAALVAFVGWVIGPVVAWVRGEAIPVGLDSEVSVPALEAAGVRHGWAAYDAYLADPSTGQRVLAIVPGLLWMALVLAGAWRVCSPSGRRSPTRSTSSCGACCSGPWTSAASPRSVSPSTRRGSP